MSEEPRAATSIFQANGTPADQAMLMHPISLIYFPWDRLQAGLAKEGRNAITLEFADLSHFGVLSEALGQRIHRISMSGGQGDEEDTDHAHIMWLDQVPGLPDEARRMVAGLARHGAIQIEQKLRDNQATVDAVISAEIAHEVDFFYLEDHNVHDALLQLMGATTPWWWGDYSTQYFKQPGESFMAALGLAYSNFGQEDPRFTPYLRRAQAPAVRQILGIERTDAGTQPPTPADPAALAAQVLVFLNQQRSAAGLRGLVSEPRLAAAAQGFAAVLAGGAPFSHTGPDGSTMGSRIHAAGYDATSEGENIAQGQATPQAVVDAWMASAGHRANILTPGFADVGIGAANGAGGWSWVVDFGSGTSTTPNPPAPPAPPAEKISGYQRPATGQTMTETHGNEPVRVLGNFVVDGQPKRLVWLGSEAPIQTITADHIDALLPPVPVSYPETPASIILSDHLGTAQGPALKFVHGQEPPPPKPPPVPQALLAVPGDGQVSLSWTPSAGATGYNVKRGTQAGGPYQTVGLPIGATYLDGACINGTTYHYVVSAVAAGLRESPNSAEVAATPSAAPQPKPSPTPGVAALAGSVSVDDVSRVAVGQSFPIQAAGVTGSVQVTQVTPAPGPAPPSPPTPGPGAQAVSPAHGKLGEAVTVTGSGFDQSCYIVFASADGQGRRAQERHAVTATAIASLVPAGAISGPLFVSRHSDNTHSGTLPFTVDDSSPAPPPVPPVPVPADALHVSLTGSDTGTGAPSSPFRSIAHAVGQARQGQTIVIHGGTWNEPLIVANSGVTVQAAPGEVPVIDGGGASKSGFVVDGKSDVSLIGLTIRRWSNLGYFQNAPRFALKNCTLTDGATSGPWAANSPNGQVVGNKIARCGNMATHGDNAWAAENCDDLLIEGNDISEHVHCGIQVFGAARLRLLNNHIHSGHGSGMILKRGIKNATVKGNRIEDSARSSQSAESRMDAALQYCGDDGQLVNNLLVHSGSGLYLTVGEPGFSCNRNLIENLTSIGAEDCSFDMAGYAEAGVGRLNDNIIHKCIFTGGRVELRMQTKGGGDGGRWGNRFEEVVAWPGPVETIDSFKPAVDAADPRIGADGRSAAFPDRGYQG